MKAMLPAVLVAFQSPKQEARYDVFAQGKKIGVAVYGVASRPGGGRTTMLRMSFLGQSTKEVSDTDANGAAIGSVRTLKRGAAVGWETVVYRRDGAAHVSLNDAAGTKSRDLPAPKGSRNDPSELWFRSVRPKPGDRAVFQSLNAAKSAWETVRVEYVGKKSRGNLVRQTRPSGTMDFVLDDRGMPLAIESSTFRMVRR